MNILECMYRSRFGRVMSFVVRQIAWVHQPFMVYGYFDSTSRKFRKYTRIGSTVKIMHKKSLSMGDHIWVGDYSILDASGGLTIEEGVQIGLSVSIFTHGAENAIRLLGREYVHIPWNERKGYTRGDVRIGAYTFVGSGSVILPGVKVGKGCIIAAGTVVTKDVPDYCFVTGTPGRIKGNTIDRDKEFVKDDDFSDTYYDSQVLATIKGSLG